MAELSLHQQLIARTNSVKDQIDGLPPTDPLKSWFLFELEQVGRNADDPAGSLQDENARLKSLSQLAHLIAKHAFQLQNSETSVVDEFRYDSISTVQARVPALVLESARELRFSIEPALLHQPSPVNDQFDPVSPTAKIVGVLRAQDQSLQLIDEPTLLSEGEKLLNELGIVDPVSRAAMSVLFQSRYHALNIAIAETKVAQIVELAAGISPRGLQWSRMSPDTLYVESDLPQLIVRKAKFIRNALYSDCEPLRGFLHCCAVDVLERSSLFQALSGVDTNKPFAIVTEGLLLYFREVELKQFLQNLHHVMAEFPQTCWVTDLVTRDDLDQLRSSHPEVIQAIRKVFSLTGRSVIPDNPFQTEDCIHRLLGDCGLRVEATVPLGSATSLLKLEHEISPARRDQIVGTRKIWQIVADRR